MTRITVNPYILGGKPIIFGTRISVEFVLELLASGTTEEELLQDYPPPRRHSSLSRACHQLIALSGLPVLEGLAVLFEFNSLHLNDDTSYIMPLNL